MSDFRDQFEEQLIAAAERLFAAPVAAPVAPRARLRSRRAALATCAAALLGGTALAATHPWSPELGTPQFREPPPTASADAPPHSQLEVLGVLRRAPTAADRGPEVRAALRYLSGISTHGIRTDYIRRLDAGASGGPVTLVPVAQWRPAAGEAAKRDALCVFAAELRRWLDRHCVGE
jgi:hypothetical protein